MNRFQVVTVTGYRLSNLAGSGGGRHPGLSATVLDTTTDREIVTFRTEQGLGRGNTPEGHRRAIAKAEAVAAELNAKYE